MSLHRTMKLPSPHLLSFMGQGGQKEGGLNTASAAEERRENENTPEEYGSLLGGFREILQAATSVRRAEEARGS